MHTISTIFFVLPSDFPSNFSTNFTPNKLNPNQNPALDFLQGQLTIDINNLEDGKLSLAAHCNPKGRVESLFYILKIDTSYFLIMPEDIIDHAKNKLMFCIFVLL